MTWADAGTQNFLGFGLGFGYKTQNQTQNLKPKIFGSKTQTQTQKTQKVWVWFFNFWIKKLFFKKYFIYINFFVFKLVNLTSNSSVLLCFNNIVIKFGLMRFQLFKSFCSFFRNIIIQIIYNERYILILIRWWYYSILIWS